MGQSRGAQSGEADRHAVWLEAHGLEPKMSPFEPTAILDEIQRLVPGYDVSRIDLLAGNHQHTSLTDRAATGHRRLAIQCSIALSAGGFCASSENTATGFTCGTRQYSRSDIFGVITKPGGAII